MLRYYVLFNSISAISGGLVKGGNKQAEAVCSRDLFIVKKLCAAIGLNQKMLANQANVWQSEMEGDTARGNCSDTEVCISLA